MDPADPDRLAPGASRRWRVFGAVVEAEGPPAFLARVAEVVPPVWQAFGSSTSDTSTITGSTSEPAVRLVGVSADDADAAVAECHHDVACAATEAVFVHAGVVAVPSRDGGERAIVIPGRSRAGKSTLVAELVRRGAAYASDEYAVLDADGFVHPYARPLGIRHLGGATVPTDPAAVAADARIVTEPLRIGAVFDVRYRHHTGPPPPPLTLERLGPAATALALFDDAVLARSRSEAVLDALVAALPGVPGWRGERGEVGDAAEALLDLVREQS